MVTVSATRNSAIRQLEPPKHLRTWTGSTESRGSACKTEELRHSEGCVEERHGGERSLRRLRRVIKH